MRSPWSATGLTRAIAIFGVVSGVAQAAKNIKADEIFEIKPGVDDGGCANYDVNQWYQDSVKLAEAAMACIEDAIAQKDRGVTNANSQKYLQTFFNINAKRPTFGGYMQELKSSVQDVIDALDDNSPAADKPWIFCDSKWAKETTWDSQAKDKGTGALNAEGKTIAQVETVLYDENWVKRRQAIADATTQEEKDELPPPFVPFWSDTDGLKRYVYDITGDYCSRDNNLAGTDDNFQPNTITFCTKNWASLGWYAKLDDIPQVTEEKLSIEKLQAQGVTMFHEMFHFALLTQHTPDTAYRLTEITRKIPTEKTGKRLTIEEAKKNPETFALFALAYELGRRNPAYTFASSASKKL